MNFQISDCGKIKTMLVEYRIGMSVLTKTEGRYLIFLFTNDMINENNNIHDVVGILDSDESISLSISSLVKKESESEYIKKKYFENQVKCPSRKFTAEVITRGMFPFGTIESIMYRTYDIRDTKSYFIEKLPINADEVFSYVLAIKREYILFNQIPQITWNLTKSRFHGKWKFEEEFNETMEAIEIIKKIGNIKINYGLLFTYRLINLLKYSVNLWLNNRTIWLYLFSESIKKRYFFSIDLILLKTLLDKIKNSNIDADDLFFRNIIARCMDNSMKKCNSANCIPSNNDKI